MDYKTKPTSRKDLRRYAKFVRRLFDVPETGPFPVLQVLDRISDIFKDCSYAVVEDHSLPPQTMCFPSRPKKSEQAFSSSRGLEGGPNMMLTCFRSRIRNREAPPLIL